jgi:prepilin-type N-terminal cleavage/methylation domain-containing protein
VQRTLSEPDSGFSLVELMVAITLTLLILSGVISLFRQGIHTSAMTTQLTEMQQNARVALNLMAQDLSIAGTGFPLGGIQLPTGSGAQHPRYGCDTSGQCNVIQSAQDDWLYGITPGDGLGPTINGAATDVVTLVYRDPDLPLDRNVLVSIATAGDSIQVNAGDVSLMSDTAHGVKNGDVLVLCNANGCAAGTVTSVSSATINFAPNDPLKFNQAGAASGNIASIANSGSPATYPPTSAYRVLITRYYVDSATNRLMRQVNALPSVPVAENVEDLQITYDTFDDATLTATANLSSLPNTYGVLNQIRKINVTVSVQAASQDTFKAKHERFSLKTSVSARNLAFRDRYS